MPDQIIVEKSYSHPIEKVWKAITDETCLKEWFVPGHFRPEVGFQYLFQNESTKVRGEVKEAVPPTRLVYTWIKNETEIETTVEWTLKSIESGTLLTILHRGIERYETEAPELLQSTQAGWNYVIGAIASFLEEHERTNS